MIQCSQSTQCENLWKTWTISRFRLALVSLFYSQVLSAPNLLRVGTTENIFVECQDYVGGDFRVTINVMNHPTKSTKLASTSVPLNSGNNFQALGSVMVNEMAFWYSTRHVSVTVCLLILIRDPKHSTYWFQIPPGDFSKDPNAKQYVYLQAQFPDRLLEKVVLVSFQSGYIFIQTDKTLYTPNSNGKFNAPSEN